MINEDSSLEGKILLSSPATSPDSYFFRTVIYIVKHDSDKGSIGLVVNNPMADIPLDILINEPKDRIRKHFSIKNITPYSGGPMDLEKGFILHSDDYNENIIEKKNSICLSSNIELIKKIKIGAGPKKSLLLFGYCGWEKGQLEEEIKNDYWIISSPSQDIIFDIAAKYKWNEAINYLRIKPAFYSSQFGHC